MAIKANLTQYNFKYISQKTINRNLQKQLLIDQNIGDLNILEPMLKYGKANKLIEKSTSLEDLFFMTYRTYQSKKAQAKNRNIAMPMSYKEYIWWWGHDWFNIGLGNGMVMARNGDKGQYRLGNIYKATARQNVSDAVQHGRISYWVNPVLVDYSDGTQEKFMSIKLACESLKINRYNFEKIKNGLLNHPLITKVAVMPKERI